MFGQSLLVSQLEQFPVVVYVALIENATVFLERAPFPASQQLGFAAYQNVLYFHTDLFAAAYFQDQRIGLRIHVDPVAVQRQIMLEETFAGGESAAIILDDVRVFGGEVVRTEQGVVIADSRHPVDLRLAGRAG